MIMSDAVSITWKSTGDVSYAGTPAVAHEDVQALVAFLGDCADSAVVEDVAEALAAMLVPSGFVCRQLTAVCQVTTSLAASSGLVQSEGCTFL